MIQREKLCNLQNIHENNISNIPAAKVPTSQYRGVAKRTRVSSPFKANGGVRSVDK